MSHYSHQLNGLNRVSLKNSVGLALSTGYNCLQIETDDIQLIKEKNKGGKSVDF